jgi:cell division protein FtsL
MSRSNRNNNRRKFTRNEKIFYTLALLIVISMVVSLVAGALGPVI